MELIRYYIGKEDFESAYLWLDNVKDSVSLENDEYSRHLQLTVIRLAEEKK